MEQWAIQYLLEHSDPGTVFEWLKDNQPKQYSFNDSREDLEKSLLGRNNPIINLGLALYGSNSSIGMQLYKKDDKCIKRAVLSGSTIIANYHANSWVYEFLSEMLTEWNEENLEAFFSNSFIPDDILIQLFERKKVFANIDDKKWIILCNYTSLNSRLSRPYNSVWMDGWDEYKYGLVFTSAWWLFDKFPRTQTAAHVLINLANKLVPESPHDMDVLKVIEKWKTKTDHKNADLFAMVRSYLGNLIPKYSDTFKALKESDDLALRQAYYRNFNYSKPDNIKADFKKDGKDFIESVVYNESVFANEAVRDAIKDACWEAPDENHYMDLPNLFNVRCDHWMSIHPEWFKDDWNGELPFEKIENQNERLEKRIEYINSQVNEIHKSLLGREDDEYISDSEKNSISYLKLNMDEIKQLLVRIYNTNSRAWSWVIAGAAIGYILAKL